MGKSSVYKLIFIFLFVLGLFGREDTKIFASPPAPAPKCYVEGVIKDVRFEKAYESECLKTNSCPTDTRTKFPDLYYLTIQIDKVSYKDGNTNFQTCDSLFPINSIKEFNIVASSLKEGDIFRNDQKIEGIVSSFWGHSFDSYQITSVTPKPCTQDENPCNPTSCSYDLKKCSGLPQTTSNPVSSVRYGHAQDYSWISGQLQYNSIEGGCWSIKFSDKQGNADNYWGIFGLELNNPQIANKLKEGSFVTIRGTVKGQEFSMACPQNIYTVSSIENEKTLPETPPIGQKQLSVFEKMKSFISGILSLISNFLSGVKSTETKTKYNY